VVVECRLVGRRHRWDSMRQIWGRVQLHKYQYRTRRGVSVSFLDSLSRGFVGGFEIIKALLSDSADPPPCSKADDADFPRKVRRGIKSVSLAESRPSPCIAFFSFANIIEGKSQEPMMSDS
jgi:hypothetical protein